MPQYGIFKAIFMSFFSKRLYRDVATNWGGKSFLYLLTIVALSSVYITYFLQTTLSEGYRTVYASILAPQVPIITVEKGIIKTPENRPYFITDPSTHVLYGVIDTTGQYTTLEQSKSFILVTQNQIITKPKPDETKIYQVSDQINQVFDPQVINQAIEKCIGYLWIGLFIAIVIFSYVFRILQAFLYSLVGKIFAWLFGVKLTYWQIVQIMMVAITPVMVIEVILQIIKVGFPHEMLLLFLLGILYMFYGILANKKDQP